jgi:hypothetical protein
MKKMLSEKTDVVYMKMGKSGQQKAPELDTLGKYIVNKHVKKVSL